VLKKEVNMEDNEIVELLYVHDEAGLKETKNKYENLLKSLSYEILRNIEDSNECVNDTYLKIWDTIPPYKPSFFKSFICKLTRQLSIDKYRYNHRKNRNNNNSISLSDLDYEISDNRTIESEFDKNMLMECINKFLDNLDVTSQILFVRKYFFFEDTKSLSKRYEISETNINVKLFRIKNNLLKYL
jgi:RNA polymerase sigma-70 factor (ECF subfamily)